MSTFDPNGVAIANGNFMGLPYSADEAQIVLIPVPWDVTTSYRPGTAKGPEAIREASLQLDLFDSDLPNAWENRVVMLSTDDEVVKMNQTLRPIAETIINHQIEGGSESDEAIAPLLKQVNEGSEWLNQWVAAEACRWLDRGVIAAIVGGEHSVPLGLIETLAGRFPGLGILHIDAHADLRDAYEGFASSHASIMFNTLKNKNIGAIVQVAIRDFCQDELDVALADDRVKQFTDSDLNNRLFNGETWAALCDEMVGSLPPDVYISFDIDGLSPELCPNTGTPVPGGLSYRQAEYLLRQVVLSGRRIIGFDLCEVASGTGNDEWDANVGARVLQKLCNLTQRSQKS